MPHQCNACGQPYPDERSVTNWNRCPDCRRAYQHAWYERNRSSVAQRTRAWKLAHPDRVALSTKQWNRTHRDKYLLIHRVGERVRMAIRRGVLVRPPTCQNCGIAGRIEAAHGDYTRPLDVRWLCVPCHRRWDVAEPKSNQNAKCPDSGPPVFGLDFSNAS
jgi:predicted Zn-ribbon and HTH transcriptional regulator